MSPRRFSFDGAKVTAFLGTGAESDQTVTVTYEAGWAPNKIQDWAGNTAASFSGHAVSNKTSGAARGLKKGTSASAVSVTAVAVTSSPASGDTYGPGEIIRVTVSFSKSVTVTGAPTLTIDMDPAHWGAKRAAYESGSGTAALTFAHTVVQPNYSTRGIAVLANSLAFNGGTITGADGSSATLAHDGLGHDGDHKVDWRLDPATASQTGVRATSSDPADSAASLTSAPTAVVTPPLTATFEGVPAEHDGRTAFAFDLVFSDNFPGRLRFKSLRDEWLQATNGRVTGARRASPGQNQRWVVTVRPDSHPDVTVTLPADSVTTESGRTLSNTLTASVIGPPLLSVADAQATEGTDTAVPFAVTLSRAASGAVTVDYATADGTATAGEDYTATSGTLTFAAGETSKTIEVPIHDDAHDEGQETFTLTLSSASGAAIQDGEATGNISNSDPLPVAWTARFGRGVATHVLDALEERIAAPVRPYVRLGGHRLGGAHDGMPAARYPVPEGSLWQEARAAAGQDPTLRRLLLDSAFHVVSGADGEAAGPRLSAWGRVASSAFDGREERLSLDGTLTTATLGVDGAWKRWLTGMIVAYSEGEGSFSGPEAAEGDLGSTLTSFHPYVSYTLSDRVRLWATAGRGAGEFRLDGPQAARAGLTLTMGAMGLRGTLLDPAMEDGLRLAVRSDALWLRMDTDKAADLVATRADVSRLRVVLEASRTFRLGGGALRPALEIGLRHDGGDAETGSGVEAGARLAYATAWGLSIEASLRGLLAHEAGDHTDWGASGALRFDPGRQGRGLSASLTPSWGDAGSAAERLWRQQGHAGLPLPHDAAQAAAGRLEAELAYGLDTLRGRALLTPYARAALAPGGEQAWHLGTRLELAQAFDLSLEASRRDGPADPEHALTLRANLPW